MFSLLLATAFAASPAHPVTLSAGLTELAGANAWGAAATGSVRVNLRPLRVDVGMREGYLAGSERALGAVTAGVSLPIGRRGPTVRVGFLHHHETPWAIAKRYPLQTALGSHSGIQHRTGLELGLGGEWPVLQRGYDGRLGLGLQASVGLFPDAGGSTAFVMLQQTLTVGVGRRREESGRRVVAPPSGD